MIKKPFEITLDIKATVHWLDPPADLVDRIRRKYIQGRITYIAYTLTESLEKAVNMLLGGK